MNSYEIVLGRRVKSDRVLAAQMQGRHVPNGFPHYSSNTGLCLCIDLCCQGRNGCKCKFCPCQMAGKDHSELVLILANTISSRGRDGENNGLHNHHPNGGRNNNG
jgi:hypothetical protein